MNMKDKGKWRKPPGNGYSGGSVPTVPGTVPTNLESGSREATFTSGLIEELRRLNVQFASPPPGWFTFGTHVDSDVKLEFWGDDAGVPIWERPAKTTFTSDTIEAESDKRWPRKVRLYRAKDFLDEGMASGFVLGAKWIITMRNAEIERLNAILRLSTLAFEVGQSGISVSAVKVEDARDSTPMPAMYATLAVSAKQVEAAWAAWFPGTSGPWSPNFRRRLHMALYTLGVIVTDTPTEMHVHNEPRMWCETCQHVHIASIPEVTYACHSCGFGSWHSETATEHESLCPGHETYPLGHVMRPVPTEGDAT